MNIAPVAPDIDERPAWLERAALDAKMRGLNAEERGLLVTLLAWQITDGPLPQQEAKLFRLARCTRREFARIWPKIKDRFTVTDDGTLVLADVVADRGRA